MQIMQLKRMSVRPAGFFFLTVRYQNRDMKSDTRLQVAAIETKNR